MADRKDAPRFALEGKDAPPPAQLKPAQTITVTWQGVVKDLPLFKDWRTEYHNVRVRYVPAKDAALKAKWASDSVLSNSVVRTYLTE